ncbi:hypothetical protein OTU49_014977 [Cherax quadricarinatus]|uniref:Uncharacterized protein n=2 Tax=Cherax quadricarinatus TaxID=27406 RepID=A0AAW0YG70_CHEQU
MDLKSLHKLDAWSQHIPLPRVLDLAVEVLEFCRKKNVISPNHLEDILPLLSFALPHNAKGCSQLLQSLTISSSVWDKLEQGLSNKKFLPIEITITLYEQYPSSLENEMLRVLTQYAEVVYTGDWCKDVVLSIAHFNSHHKFSDTDQSRYKSMKNHSPFEAHQQRNKINFWAESPVINAAARSKSVFSSCLKLLFKIVVETRYSISSVFGSMDYFEELKSKMHRELHEYFPSDIQHLVYLLTLPVTTGQGLKYFENYSQVLVVQNSLSEALQRGDVTTIRVLLCFFPYWLPILEQNQFLDKYVRQEWCELSSIS